MEAKNNNNHYLNLAKEKLITFIVFTLGILFLLLIYKAFTIFLVLFTSILFACFLLGISRWISEKTKISRNLCLWLTVLIIFILIAGIYYFMGYKISEQASSLSHSIKEAVTNLKEKISQNELGQKLLNKSPDFNSMESQTLFKKAFGYFSSFIGILGNFIVFIAMSLFIAGSPDTYTKGFIKLFPKNQHKTVDNLLNTLSKTLFRWLAGRLLDMTVLGILTGVGLWILGIPLALTLGILSAILSFIPNIGPFLGAVLPILLAFTISFNKALYVVILFIVIQLLESYFLTPFIQKKAVHIPPMLLLLGQLIFAILAGIPGLLLATPLMAVLMILVQKLYIEKVLDEKVE